MTWKTRYIPPDAKIWQGRADTPPNACFFQIMKILNLANNVPVITNNQITFALIGFSCDEGIRRNLGRTGSAQGPNMIRSSLARVPLTKKHFACYDAGNITCSDGDLESAQTALAEVVALLINHNMIPIVLGGGHELAWGHYQGLAKVYAHRNLGIVNFDAHFDMRPLPPNHEGTSGTPFLQIAKAHEKENDRFDYNCIGIQPSGNINDLFATAEHYHTEFILADEIHQGYTEKCVNLINRVIFQNQIVYLSICLDVFAAPYAPGVSAPQALGLTPWQVIPLVRRLASSGKLVSYDIAELSPKYDLDNRTANLAANLIREITHYHSNNLMG